MHTEASTSLTTQLIVHADDVGLCRAVNEATWIAIERGCVTSASIMAPCPAFDEAAQYARHNRHVDWGVHLTLTSEWGSYRWGPIAPAASVPSLIDQDGYLWPDAFSFARHADLREAEMEIRAQIERVLLAGIQPSHLDNHMFSLHRSMGLLAILDRVARDYHLPYLQPRRGKMNNSSAT